MRISEPHRTARKRPSAQTRTCPPVAIFLIPVAILLLASLLAYVSVDRSASDWCRAHAAQYRDHPLLRVVKELGRCWAPMWLLAILAWVRARPRILVATVLVLALTAVTSTSAKYLVGRPRPNHTREYNQKRIAAGKHPSYSFPSGDATTAFAFATVAAISLVSWQRVVPFLLAACAAALRVVALKHFPSDVLAGAALGLVCGWLAHRLATRLMSRAPPHWRHTRKAFWLVLASTFLIPPAMFLLEESYLTLFLAGGGPAVACVLILTKGRAWLRWAAGRGFGAAAPQRRRVVMAALLIIWLGALGVLTSLGWTMLHDRDEGHHVGLRVR